VVSTTQQVVSSTCKFKRVDLKNLKYTLLKKESESEGFVCGAET